MDTERNYASKGLAGTALGLGIGALGVEVLRGGLGGILGGNVAPATAAPASNSNASDVGAAIAASVMPLVASIAASGSRDTCSDDHLINRYEASKDARIAELETEVKLRDANTYTDQKMLELYQYTDGRLRNIESQICQQAVVNAQVTANISCIQNNLNELNGMTKTVIPISNVCPEPMARYNSWTAPTTETTT